MDQRKIAILSTVAIVILGTIGIGVAAWRLRQAPAEEPAGATTPTGGTPEVTETGAPPPGQQPPAASSGQAVTIVTPPKTPPACDASVADADCDLDGLTNGEETKAKTDPNDPDTDDDGVSDAGEINTWKSDPLDPKSIDPSMSDYDAIAAGKKDSRPFESQ